MSDDTNNKVVQTDNHYSVTKEAYTNLAEKYQNLLTEIHAIYDVAPEIIKEREETKFIISLNPYGSPDKWSLKSIFLRLVCAKEASQTLTSEVEPTTLRRM